MTTTKEEQTKRNKFIDAMTDLDLQSMAAGGWD
jgi:hypothetical protein